jgi:hemolysin activation/secretion protein
LPQPEEVPRPPAPPGSVLPPPPPQPPAKRPFLPVSVFVRQIKVVGSTVFSEQELSKITTPYTNRKLTTADLEALRLDLTKLYISRGYVTSGAVIPDQDVKDGVIIVQIIEGKLSNIELEGNYWFLPGFLRSRIERSAKPPLNINQLQERLQLLQETPGIVRLNAELRPGTQRGESTLNVRVTEADPFKAWLEFNNYQSPSVGAERGLVTLAHQSFTGHGDIIMVQYGRSHGVDPQLTTRYILPVNAYDTTVAVEYRKNDFLVVEEPFKSLDIKSKSDILGFTIRQPLYRTLTQEFAVAITGEYETNKLFLLGQPTDLLSPGSQGGVSRVAALRFSQEWVRRSTNQVIAALSRFSVGIDALGATINSDPNLPDGQFFSWLGQAQYARRFEPLKIQLIARLTAQLSNDHLFPLEQMSVGGRYSVRGYRENTLVRDNAVLASLELRVPVLRSGLGEDIVQLAPFADFGRGTNTKADSPDPDTLASVGIGLIWNIWRGSRFEVYWGQELNHISTPGGNLQDHGLHLQLVVEAF